MIALQKSSPFPSLMLSWLLPCMLLLMLAASAAAHDSAAGWLEMGQASLLNGSFQEAVESFDRALKFDPENASAWGGKATALTRLGRYKMAELYFDYALAKDPKNANLWLEDGRARELDGDFPEALQSYEQALALDGSLSAAWLGKANSSLALQSYDEAMHSFKNASLYGEGKAAQAGLIRVLLAQASQFLQEGKYEAAYNASNDALALDPQNFRALHLKGATLGSMGRWEESLACYTMILAANSSDQQAEEGKARSLVGLGKRELASGNFSRAIEPILRRLPGLCPRAKRQSPAGSGH